MTACSVAIVDWFPTGTPPRLDLVDFSVRWPGPHHDSFGIGLIAVVWHLLNVYAGRSTRVQDQRQREHCLGASSQDDISANSIAACCLNNSPTFHSLRHFFATMLIAAGADPTEVQRALRHKLLRTTLETYVHWWPRKRRLRNVVSDALRHAAEGQIPPANRQDRI
jgi:hypothetical protein